MSNRVKLHVFLCVIAFSYRLACAQATGGAGDVCAQVNIGSAIGAGECYASQLRAVDAELVQFEAKYADAIAATASSPSTLKRAAESEARAWRAYRFAKCELVGENEGGSEGWKSAIAASCEVAETNARLAILRDQISKK